MNILKLNSISDKINGIFQSGYNLVTECSDPDAILVRSFNMADYKIDEKLLAVGRAGAGVNNIPVPRMTESGVAVFNTPGANANAVKELTVCALFLASRDITGGVAWANTLTENVAKTVEAGKAKFGGYEITGKTLGVIGLGAIGVKVANAALALGMNVVGTDPYLSEALKKQLSPEVSVTDFDTVIANSDYITLHVPLLDSTKEMINTALLSKMRAGVSIINMSRAELVSLPDLKAAIANGKIRRYVVDFPTEEALNTSGIIAVPHLGASTEEAEENCAVMAGEQLKDYIENGNVVNSVNLPSLSAPRALPCRMTVIYKNCPDFADVMKKKFPSADIKTAQKKDIGYAIIDSGEPIAVEKCDCGCFVKVRTL